MIGFLARTTPALTRELPPSRSPKHSISAKPTSSSRRASSVAVQTQSRNDGAARSVGRGQYVLGFTLAGLGGVRVGLNYPRPLGVKKLECHHRMIIDDECARCH